VRELVDEDDVGSSGDDGIDVELLEGMAPTIDRSRRDDLEVSHLRVSRFDHGVRANRRRHPGLLPRLADPR
jgi:hypothetical protein